MEGLALLIGIVGALAFWYAIGAESGGGCLVFLGAIGALIGLETLSGSRGETAPGFVVLALGVGLFFWLND